MLTTYDAPSSRLRKATMLLDRATRSVLNATPNAIAELQAALRGIVDLYTFGLPVDRAEKYAAAATRLFASSGTNTHPVIREHVAGLLTAATLELRRLA